jgi:hypothetical protein
MTADRGWTISSGDARADPEAISSRNRRRLDLRQQMTLENTSGGDDLGGKQTWRPEDYRMTAAA